MLKAPKPYSADMEATSRFVDVPIRVHVPPMIER